MKQKIFSLINDYVLAILAGLAISIGCIAFLSSENKIAGSLFFTVGLFLILTMNFNLFTGKVCYALDNDKSYILKLLVIWLGNLTGTVLIALLLRLTRLTSLQTTCINLANTKLNDSWYSVFILGIFCNILIYLAVEGFKNFDSPLTRIVALFFGVSIFVLCGFEHCVADMFYFTFAAAWSWKTLGYLLLITLGNIVGGLLIPCVKKLNKFLRKDN